MKLSDMQHKPIAYILVGLPGSGKSTWMRKILQGDQEFTIVSSDHEIESYAKSKGVTYSDVFDVYIPTATSIMNNKLEIAIKSGANIIWDQTNLTVKKRGNIVRRLKNYKKIAVVFAVDRVELEQRLEARAKAEGKNIPLHVVDRMEQSFEFPTEAEGFDKIITV